MVRKWRCASIDRGVPDAQSDQDSERGSTRDESGSDFDDDFLKLREEMAPSDEALARQRDRPQQDGFDRTTSGSSDSGDSGTESPKKAAKGSSSASVSAVVEAKRDRTNHMQFGRHHLVLRFQKGKASGLHMTCRCAGHIRCSKETSFQVLGSEDLTRQYLKAWALLGEGLIVPHLGVRSSEVPEAVHSQMEDWASQGHVPITSPQDRARNRRTANTEYGVPDAFAEALKCGYFSPSLPPPTGLIWVAGKGKWRLSIRGG